MPKQITSIQTYDPYKAAYGAMPSHAASNAQIKQLYVGGHFCYVYKIGIVTNCRIPDFFTAFHLT